MEPVDTGVVRDGVPDGCVVVDEGASADGAAAPGPVGRPDPPARDSEPPAKRPELPTQRSGPPEQRSGPPDQRSGPRPELTDRDRRILAFERGWWRHAGAKEQAIRDAFDLSSTRYYQILNGLLDNPAALAHDPVLVGRLRRLRAARVRSRRGTDRVA